MQSYLCKLKNKNNESEKETTLVGYVRTMPLWSLIKQDHQSGPSIKDTQQHFERAGSHVPFYTYCKHFTISYTVFRTHYYCFPICCPSKMTYLPTSPINFESELDNPMIIYTPSSSRTLMSYNNSKVQT